MKADGLILKRPAVVLELLVEGFAIASEDASRGSFEVDSAAKVELFLILRYFRDHFYVVEAYLLQIAPGFLNKQLLLQVEVHRLPPFVLLVNLCYPVVTLQQILEDLRTLIFL